MITNFITIKEKPPYLKLIIFLMILVISLIFTTLIGALFAIPFYGFDIINNLSELDISNPENISVLKYFQIVNQLGLFIFPCLIFAFLVNQNVSEYLKINKRPMFLSLIIAGLIMLAAIPVVNWLSNINGIISLPKSLEGIENLLKNYEKSAEKMTEVFLNVHTLSGLTLNIVMIGIIPAVGEEFLFRGVLLRLFNDWTKNCHIAILITAFLFSAMHLQFFGFIPRMLIGILFGYLFVWTRSLWIPIFAHFINNTFAVIITFLTNKGIINTDLDVVGTRSNDYIYLIISIIVVSFLIIKIFLAEKKKLRSAF